MTGKDYFTATRRLRAALLTSSALALAWMLPATGPARAQDATWQTNPGSGDFFDANNWTPNSVPTGTATFGTSNTTTLTLGSSGSFGGWRFNAGASDYGFNVLSGTSLDFTGAGIIINGGSATITNSYLLNFRNTSTAGSANITNGGTLNFNNASTAGNAAITNNGALQFFETSTAGNAAITNNGFLQFYGSSTAGSAAINNNNYMYFGNTSTAGSATINNSATMAFSTASTAGSANISNYGNLIFQDTSTAGTASITNNSALQFYGSSTAGNAALINNAGGTVDFTYTAGLNNDSKVRAGSIAGAGNYILGSNELTVGSNNLSTEVSGVISGAGSLVKTGTGTLTLTGANTYAGGTTINGGTLQLGSDSAVGSILGTVTVGSSGAFHVFNADTSGITIITNGGLLSFRNTSTAGSAGIVNNNILQFLDTSTAGSATITNDGNLFFLETSTAGNAAITNNSALQFYGSSTAGSATITNNGSVNFFETSTAGSATITNDGSLNFHDTSTAGNATITNGGFLNFRDASTAGSATITNSLNLYFFGNSTAGNAALINNAGGIIGFSNSTGPNGDGKLSAGSIAGAGNYILGANELTVGSNNLSTEVSGVISGSGSLVKTGTGTLTLTGANTYAGATTVDRGVLRVDGSIETSSGVTVNSNGALMGTGAVGGTAIDSGGALLGGNGTAGTSLTISGNLAFQSGAYYLVEVNPATASFVNVTGMATLGGATVNAAFAGSYVAKQYTILTAGSVSGTFDPLVNTNLSSNFRTKLSYDATHAYLSLTLSFVPPSGSGLGGNQQNVGNAIVNSFNSNGGISLVHGSLMAAGLTQASGETATGSQQTTFQAMGQFMGLLTDPFSTGRETAASGPPAYADGGPAGAARDTYALMAKAPPARTFEQRWSVWAAGFGGSQTTDGNTAQGSNSATSRLFGTAAGAEYAFSPQTLAGFALAGGGTSFSVANGGSGRSDLFQAGAYLRHTNGAGYVSAALAYGWQDVVTDRTVTLAGVDRLRAEFNANAISGRLEGGYRFIAPWAGGIGLTPYAAGQFTTFDLPAYAETVVSGSNAFALAYAAKSVTDTRSELGLRTDKSFAMANGVLTLRGRAAWAHDFNPDRAVAATFQALPGASFVVGGARPAADSALTTAAAEMKWLNGWSASASFEGEFSGVTRSYAGKGTVRYAW